MLSESHLRRLLALLIAGSRGGPTRLRLLDLVAAEPRNAHQVAKALAVDYKTAEHHLRILSRAGLIAGGEGYAGAYQLSPLLEAHWAVLRSAFAQPEGFGETQINRKEQAKL